jgi:hypothetical protein
VQAKTVTIVYNRKKREALMQDPDKDLPEILLGIGKHFRENELAYLAVTSKIERPFQNNLAYLLHQTYGPREFIVSREWHSVDIAILRKDFSPLCLIELTSMYVFDSKDGGYLKNAADKMKKDEVKAVKRGREQTYVYSLLLATNVNGPVGKEFGGVVKYLADINSSLLEYGDVAALLRYAENKIRSEFHEREVIAEGKVNGGHVFGVDVSVLYWLVKSSNQSR